MNTSRESNKQLQSDLKILVVLNSLVGTFGGGSTHIVEITNYWGAFLKIHFLISKAGYKIARVHIQERPNKEVILYSAPFDGLKRNELLVYFFRIIKSILTKNLERKYEVIVAANYLPQNMIPAILKKKIKSKLVVYFHEASPFLKKKNIVYKVISVVNWNLSLFMAKLFFDLIFVANSVTKQYLLKRGLNPQKIILTSNAVPFKEISDIVYERKIFEGVFLGRLVQRKGVHDLTKIWKIVVRKYPFARLCIMGDGLEREKLEVEIKEGDKENITLAGRVPEGEKYELMKESKIFIFPSYQEGWGIVIAEAMACGLPVVAYDLPVYKEVFNGYVFTVKIGDYEGMAKKVIDILENPRDYEKIVEEARNFVSRYSWERVAEHELSYIREIAGK